MRAGTPIAERWVGMYELAAGAAVGHEAMIANLIEELSASEGRERVLREALERTVWRERSQFPGNPFCVICGAGKKWVAIHGHEASCPLATPTPEQQKCSHHHPLRKMTNDGWEYWCGDCGILIQHPVSSAMNVAAPEQAAKNGPVSE